MEDGQFTKLVVMDEECDMELGFIISNPNCVYDSQLSEARVNLGRAMESEAEKFSPGRALESEVEEFSPLPEMLEVPMLSSGTSNEKNGPVILQSDDFLQQIKETNGHASRNILQKQKSILGEGTEPVVKKSSTVTSFASQDSTRTTPTSAQESSGTTVTSKGKVVPKLVTKVALMRKQVSTLEKLALEFQPSTADQENYLKLKNLKLLLEIGVISQEEFSAQAKELMGL
ncbi:hypothetical protein R1flu_025028 [Riccia fluitans]|uniref:SHOCT domain-containing protein n=1 Tax=Riccia fluitans TaxID=41844 RepID=A0ABD1XZL1_9MARC